MTMRVVQSGDGQARDLVVVYYLAQQIDASVQAAAPGAIIVNDTRANTAEYRTVGKGGIEAIGELAARLAAQFGCIVRSVTLVGYSAGCQALRAQLLRTGGSGIDGLVPIDGTHASYPKPNDTLEIDPWRDFAEQARAKRKVMTATHSMLTYVEKLPQPFMSTWNVLRRVTGWTLDKQGPYEAPVVTCEGNLEVRSYDSADAAGHRYQGQHALPSALQTTLERLQQRTAATVTQVSAPAEPVDEPWRDPEKGPGERALAWAFAQLKLGQREVPPGSNGGPFVAECLAPCVRDGVGKLGLDHGNWCAAFACASDYHARLEGDLPPVHQYRASGYELEQDAAKAGAWHEAGSVRAGLFAPEPGDIVIFKSGVEAWQRHVTRFVTWIDQAAGKYQTIGGNEQDGIRLTTHDLAEDRLRGFIDTPHGGEPASEPAGIPQLADLMARATAALMGLGSDIMGVLARLHPDNDGEDTA